MMSAPMRLLIGYDGSPCADAAIEDLARAGLPAQVEATVLAIADVWIPPGDEMVDLPAAEWISPARKSARGLAGQLVEEAQALAQRACARLQAEYPDWEVRAEARADSPAWGILLRAEEGPTDLVVVGSHSRSPLRQLMLGSVSQTVVTQAHCSVRVARARGAAPHRPLCILVGVDGSPQAQATARVVAQRIWPSGSHIQIVVALDPMLLTALAYTALPGERFMETPDERGRLRAQAVAETAAELFHTQDPTLTVSTAVLEGDPKQILLEEAERWDADCIFVGARGRNRLQRLWLGSVSAAVAARAPCSVEVVRHTPAAGMSGDDGTA